MLTKCWVPKKLKWLYLKDQAHQIGRCNVGDAVHIYRLNFCERRVMKKKDIPLNNDNKFNLPSEHFG